MRKHMFKNCFTASSLLGRHGLFHAAAITSPPPTRFPAAGSLCGGGATSQPFISPSSHVPLSNPNPRASMVVIAATTLPPDPPLSCPDPRLLEHGGLSASADPSPPTVSAGSGQRHCWSLLEAPSAVLHGSRGVGVPASLGSCSRSPPPAVVGPSRRAVARVSTRSGPREPTAPPCWGIVALPGRPQPYYSGGKGKCPRRPCVARHGQTPHLPPMPPSSFSSTSLTLICKVLWCRHGGGGGWSIHRHGTKGALRVVLGQLPTQVSKRWLGARGLKEHLGP